MLSQAPPTRTGHNKLGNSSPPSLPPSLPPSTWLTGCTPRLNSKFLLTQNTSLTILHYPSPVDDGGQLAIIDVSLFHPFGTQLTISNCVCELSSSCYPTRAAIACSMQQYFTDKLINNCLQFRPLCYGHHQGKLHNALCKSVLCV